MNLWNWQQDDWPFFSYETEGMALLENEFLHQSGITYGISRHLNDNDQKDIVVTLLSEEALKSSEIEGEILDRHSLQSSIKRHFGLQSSLLSNHPKENGMAQMMMDLYHHYDEPLTHETLGQWHQCIMNGRNDIAKGVYRTHGEPMQIISGYTHAPKIHFEAPPSFQVPKEMDQFIVWFNQTGPTGETPLPPLRRSGIAHLYFESIHPFEDGNGRLGRALVDKILAQHLKYPALIALSYIIQKHKKIYYDALEKHNKNNHITDWLIYFGQVILQAQKYTRTLMEFLIIKTKFFNTNQHLLNERQLKAIMRLFQEGPQGFAGGLSAKNYMVITSTSASTATRDLSDLVEKNILYQTGALKGTRYWLTCLNSFQYMELN